MSGVSARSSMGCVLLERKLMAQLSAEMGHMFVGRGRVFHVFTSNHVMLVQINVVEKDGAPLAILN